MSGFSRTSDEVRLKADTTDALALLVGDTPEACAETTAAEIARLVGEGAPFVTEQRA